MENWNDTRLGLLHDHYKDTFSINREREKQRDGLFYVIIALFGVLFLEVQYPSNFQSMFSEVGAQGAKLDLRALPFAAILSATWTLTLAIAMRYCQVATHIERQYTYLHKLEDKMKSIVGNDVVFSREGAAYLQDYPVYSIWSTFFYTVMFPLIVVAAVIPLLYVEWTAITLPIYHQIYDTIIAIAIITSFALFRTIPQIGRLTERTRFTLNRLIEVRRARKHKQKPAKS